MKFQWKCRQRRELFEFVRRFRQELRQFFDADFVKQLIDQGHALLRDIGADESVQRRQVEPRLTVRCLPDDTGRPVITDSP